MAYGLYLYKDLRTDLRLEIWRKDWMLGAVEIAAMDSTPIELVGLDNSGSDILTPIIKSSVNINIKNLGEINFEEFFTADATKFKVIVKEKGKQVWGGYITPDSYSQPYEYRNSVNLIARDNLGLLNQLDYDLFDDPFVAPKRLVDEAQIKIGWAMSFVEWQFEQNESKGGVKFKDAEINVELFREKTWWEVLEMVLLSGGQQMRYIGNNRVAICNVADLYNLYLMAPRKEITHSLGQAAQMEVVPSWKELEIKQDYSTFNAYMLKLLKESEYIFHKKETWEAVASASRFGGNYYRASGLWKNSTLVDPVLLANPHLRDISDTASLYLSPLNSASDDKLAPYIYQSINVRQFDKTTSLSLKIKAQNELYVAMTNYLETNDWFLTRLDRREYSWTLQCKLIFISETNQTNQTYYFSANGWESDASKVEIISFDSKFSYKDERRDNEFTVNIASLPSIEGQLQICLLPIKTGEPAYGERVASIARISSISLACMDVGGGKTFKGRVNERGNVKESIDIAVGEVPVNSGDYLAYAGGLFESGKYHKALSGWHRKDNKGGVRPLSELIGRGYAHHFVAFKNVNGERTGGKVITANIDFDNSNSFVGLYVINGEDYILNSARCNLLRKTAEVTLRQVLPYVHQEGEYDANAVDGGGGSVIGGGDNTVVLWGTEGGGVHSTKRTYQLPTNGNLSDLFVLTDKVGDATASKVPLSSLLNRPHASTHAKDGADPVTPAAIGAASENHNHDDSYHPKGGNMKLDFWAKVLTAIRGVFDSVEAKFVKSEKVEATEVIAGEVRSDNHSEGVLGGGYRLYNNPVTGESTLEVGNVIAKMGVTTVKWTVQTVEAVGGVRIKTDAYAQIVRIVPSTATAATRYCYKSKYQVWKVGDQPRMQNGVDRFFWGVITEVGKSADVEDEHWFAVSESAGNIMAGSKWLEIGDDVVLCGYRGVDSPSRSTVWIESTGADRADGQFYSAIYEGVDSFQLPESKLSYLLSKGQIIFMSSRVQFIAPSGEIEKRANERGSWLALGGDRRCWSNDRVSYEGALWLCVARDAQGSPSTTTDAPSLASLDWLCEVPKGSKGDRFGQVYMWTGEAQSPSKPVGRTLAAVAAEGWVESNARRRVIVNKATGRPLARRMADGTVRVLTAGLPKHYRLYVVSGELTADGGELVGEWSEPLLCVEQSVIDGLNSDIDTADKKATDAKTTAEQAKLEAEQKALQAKIDALKTLVDDSEALKDSTFVDDIVKFIEDDDAIFEIKKDEKTQKYHVYMKSAFAERLVTIEAFVTALTVCKLKTVRNAQNQGIEIEGSQINIFDGEKVVATLTGAPLPPIEQFNADGGSGSHVLAEFGLTTSETKSYPNQIFRGIGAGSIIRVITTLRTNQAPGNNFTNPPTIPGMANVRVVLMYRAIVTGAWVEYEDVASVGGRNSLSVDRQIAVSNSGDYSLQFRCVATPNSKGFSSSIEVGSTTFSYNYLDSRNMMSWYCGNGFGLRGNKDNYVHISFLNKIMSMAVKGNFDAPNIALVGYNINHQGQIDAESRFGVKYSTSSAAYEGGGVFKVPHAIGHKNYNPIVALENSIGSWTPVERGTNFVRIKLTDLGGNPVQRAFSITIFGKN